MTSGGNFLTIILRTNHFQPDVEKIHRAGFPQAKVKRRLLGGKELIVEIQESLVSSDKIDVAREASTAEEVGRRRDPSTLGGRRSLFEVMTQTCDLVDVRRRRKTDGLLNYLYCGSDIRSSKVIRWQIASRDEPARWASVTFTRRQPGQTDESSVTSVRSEANGGKATRPDESSATLVRGNAATAKTADDDVSPAAADILARMFTPSTTFVDERKRLLAALEQHGILWSQCAFVCRPTQRCPKPQEQAQVMIQGLFPETFLRACTSSSFNSAEYINDEFRHWHMRRTFEPFQIGTPLAVSSAGLGTFN